jgi:FG-GAP repeat
VISISRRLIVLAVLGVLVAALPAAAQFETRSLTTTNTGPNGVVAADFNHDGKMDIAVSSPYSPYEV